MPNGELMPGTGIYRREIRTFGPDAESLKEGLEELARDLDLDRQLAGLKAIAQCELEACGAKKERRGCPYTLPENPPPAARDANELLVDIHILDHWLEEGNARAAAWIAIRIGRRTERMMVRRFEPHAKRGRTVLAAASRGGTERWSNEETRAGLETRQREYRVGVDAIHREYPRLSWSAVCARVAKKHGVSAKTVQRHTGHIKWRAAT
jgi:hypothetical protein